MVRGVLSVREYMILKGSVWRDDFMPSGFGFRLLRRRLVGANAATSDWPVLHCTVLHCTALYV